MLIALVTSDHYKNGYCDSEILIKAFSALGHEASLVVWDDSDVDWSVYDIVLLHTPWDYTNKFLDFMDWCKLVNKQTLLVNNLKTLKYNSTKRYLLHLQQQGISIPPTRIINKGTSFDNAKFKQLINHQLVIKPAIDAGGKRARNLTVFKRP